MGSNRIEKVSVPAIGAFAREQVLMQMLSIGIGATLVLIKAELQANAWTYG